MSGAPMNFSPEVKLPAELMHNGPMSCGEKRFHLFTELDGGPSHGATFGVDVEEVVREAIIRKRAEKRTQFARALEKAKAQ